MTQLKKSDVISYMYFLRLLYGEKAYNYEEEELEKVAQFWFEQLQAYPKEIVNKAIRQATNTCEYPPTLAHIMKILSSMEESVQKDENELWSELEGVLYEVYDNSTKYKFASGEKWIAKNRAIYESLSPEIKAYVKNCGQLVALANADDRTLSIEKSRFINAYPNIKKRAKYQAMLPSEYKEIISQTAKKLQIENKGE